MSSFICSIFKQLCKTIYLLPGETVGERLVQHLQPLIERYEGVEWAGCRGSAPHYGGYPCGQWSLWHTLTVRQRAARTGRPTQVLSCCQLAEILEA